MTSSLVGSEMCIRDSTARTGSLLRLKGFDEELDFDAFLYQSVGREICGIAFGVFLGPSFRSRMRKTFLKQWGRLWFHVVSSL
eukprot:357547-Prorocentrum_lima.AAC.1